MKNIIIIALVIAAIYFISQKAFDFILPNYLNTMQNFGNSLKNEKTVSKVINTRDTNQKLEEDILKNPENY